jgi:DNA-binding GntR family transcriptional regulator
MKELPFHRWVILAKQTAYQFIRDLDGTYRGGELLTPHSIAEQLEIDRTSVRECLRQPDDECLAKRCTWQGLR